jgi:hypothetical protein
MFQSACEHKIEIEVIRDNMNGLEFFEVRVNGTLAHTRMSEAEAWRDATRLAEKTGGEVNLNLKLAA